MNKADVNTLAAMLNRKRRLSIIFSSPSPSFPPDHEVNKHHLADSLAYKRDEQTLHALAASMGQLDRVLAEARRLDPGIWKDAPA